MCVRSNRDSFPISLIYHNTGSQKQQKHIIITKYKHLLIQSLRHIRNTHQSCLEAQVCKLKSLHATTLLEKQAIQSAKNEYFEKWLQASSNEETQIIELENEKQYTALLEKVI